MKTDREPGSNTQRESKEKPVELRNRQEVVKMNLRGHTRRTGSLREFNDPSPDDDKRRGSRWRVQILAYGCTAEEN